MKNLNINVKQIYKEDSVKNIKAKKLIRQAWEAMKKRNFKQYWEV